MIATGMTELRISDTYMQAHWNDESAVIDVMLRTPTEAFEPTSRTVARSGSRGEFNQIGIKINDTAGDADATHAWLDRSLKNNGPASSYRSRYICGSVHPESVRTIRPYQSNARGISIFS